MALQSASRVNFAVRVAFGPGSKPECCGDSCGLENLIFLKQLGWDMIIHPYYHKPLCMGLSVQNLLPNAAVRMSSGAKSHDHVTWTSLAAGTISGTIQSAGDDLNDLGLKYLDCVMWFCLLFDIIEGGSVACAIAFGNTGGDSWLDLFCYGPKSHPICSEVRTASSVLAFQREVKTFSVPWDCECTGLFFLRSRFWEFLIVMLLVFCFLNLAWCCFILM